MAERSRTSGFSVWKRWPDRHELANLEYPGVYVLCWSCARLQGKRFSWRPDIIYVGMTNSIPGLAGRLRQFDDTVAGRRTYHGGADRVRYRYRSYQRLISQLYVSVHPVICSETSNLPRDLRLMGKVVELEYLCQARYAQKFGGLPQFNDKRQAPKYSLTIGRQRRRIAG